MRRDRSGKGRRRSVCSVSRPSPNGYLHRGHALSALLNYRAARNDRRPLSAPHRGHRPDAHPRRFRNGDLRRSRLARARLGSAGAPAERTFRRLSRRARRNSRQLGLLYPAFLSRAEIQAEVAAAEAAGKTLAARSGWCSALPRQRARLAKSAPRRRDRRRAALCAAARHAPRACRLAAAFMARARSARTVCPTQTVAADPAAWGDVILARKEVAGELPPLRGHRRRVPGHHRRGARAGPEACDIGAPAAANAARPARAQPTSITG